MKFKYSFSGLVIVSIILFATMASARNIYVDGSLTSDCLAGTYSIANRACTGSDGIAFRMPQKGADNATAGDTVLFRQGTYYAPGTASATPVLNVQKNGTGTNPITFKAYNGETVIIAAQNTTAYKKFYGIQLGLQGPTNISLGHGTSVDNIIIEGFTVVNSTSGAILINGGVSGVISHNITIRNCTITKNTGSGISTLGTVEYAVIENNLVYENYNTGLWFGYRDKNEEGAQQNASQRWATHYSIIRNNLAFSNNNPNSPGNTDGISIGFGYNCTVEGNVVYNNSDDGIDIYAADNIIVKDNLVFNHWNETGNANALKLSAGGGGNHTIEGNVLIDSRMRGIESSHATMEYNPNLGNFFYGNIVYKNFWVGMYYGCSGSAGNFNNSLYDNILYGNEWNNTMAYHDIWLNGNCLKSDYNNIGAHDLAALRTTYGTDSHSKNTTPSFVDPTVTINTSFNPTWTFGQKIDFIKQQFRNKFSPNPNSSNIDNGTIIAGYHCSTSGSHPGAGCKEWYGSAPDIGVYESNYSSGNTVPTLSGIPDQNTNEDTAPPANWVDLYPYASDAQDPDTSLTFSIDSQTNSGLISCSIGSNRYLNCGTPAADQSGYNDVTVRVTDTGSLYATDTTRITVNAVNDAPTTSAATDAPDPVTVGSSVTFSVTWSDVDDSQTSAKICKTNAISAGSCTGGSWCTSALSSSNPATCQYTTSAPDIGTQNYYAFACDDENACSSSRSGTFTVNALVGSKINFVAPTPANGSSTSTIIINATIDVGSMTKNIFNWNGANYSFYDSSLKLMLNFDNVAALGENSTVVKDVSSSALTGTPTGNAHYVTDGKYNGAYYFDGSGDYLNLGNQNIVSNVSGMTVSAWVKLTDDEILFPGSNGIVTQDDNTPRIFLLRRFQNAFYFRVYNNSATGNYLQTGIINQANRWYHVVGTLDSTTHNISIYVDGNLAATTYWGIVNTASGSSLLEVGRGDNGELNGTVDQVMIWNRGLNAGEVRQLYLTGLWKYNPNSWLMLVNQTSVSSGTYNYQAFASNSSNNYATEVRVVTKT